MSSWGEDALCKDISIVAGGSLLNSAVHGANFSAYRQVDIQINAFGVVGLDTQGDICMKAMRQHPLIVDKVIEKSEYTTGTCIVLSGEQDRLFVTSRGWYTGILLISPPRPLYIFLYSLFIVQAVLKKRIWIGSKITCI
jgi:sugar/nucleoside kinase (ribokinase family)